MINLNDIGLRFGAQVLFEGVNIKFDKGNCYGLIGANGSGKSTLLKIISGDIDSTKGDVYIPKNERLSVLKQDHNEYDESTVLDTVIRGNATLYKIMKDREQIYMKEDFSDADGIKAGELEEKFADLDGWSAESNASILLEGLGIENSLHEKLMKDLKGSEKVKVLLAQALFGSPDNLLLDEPTNHLDIDAKNWLEEFLINFENTVIVVSHDRHFLNKVCTHMVDIDFQKARLYSGNYDFWYESSQLLLKQSKDSNKKKEEKIKELQQFIARFSANASKSKQATSRKKSLEKIELDEIKPSSRKYPYINFDIEREIGKDVLSISDVSKTINGVKVLSDININIHKDDRVAFIGQNELAINTLFKIINGEMEPDTGFVKSGTTVTQEYFPKNFDSYFYQDCDIVDWLRQYSVDQTTSYVRGLLGRMLFSGDDVLKNVNVLSGGEKVRCMLSKLMTSKANCITFEDPTNHLDIESITSLNTGMKSFKGVIIFSSNDHELLQTVANRIVEINEDGTYTNKSMTYDEYIDYKNILEKKQ